jgi:hypothetical protein
MAVAHMRQNIDRGVGDEIDVIAAEGQRARDIAGIEHIEKIQYALPVELFDQCFSPPVLRPTRISRSLWTESRRDQLAKSFGRKLA